MLIPPQAAFALALALAASRPVPIPPEGGRGTFALDPMQWRRHEIALEAGQFFQATLHQRGLDLMLRLVAPDGRVIEDQVDSSEGSSGMEPASMLATAAGTYAIEVWAPADMDVGGSYELEAASPRAPVERDRMRLRAEALMAAGGRVMGPRATGVGRRPRSDVIRGVAAVAAYREAGPLWSALDESCWQAEAATCLGINFYWLHAWDESSDNLVAATDLWQSCGDEHKFLESVLYVGRWFVGKGRYRDAAQTYEFGLRLAEERQEPILGLQFLVQLTLTYGHLGDTEQALRYGEEALPILRERGYRQGAAMTLTHLAAAHLRRGELERAIERLLESLPVHWSEQELGGGTSTLVTLGEVYGTLGEPDIALDYFQKVIERVGGTGALQEVQALTGRATILAREGRLEPSLVELARAIVAARRNRLDPAETAARLQLARLLLEKGDHAHARENVHAAQAILATSGDRVASADALELSGLLDLAAGRPHDARAAFAEGLALRRFVGDRVGEAGALQLQARLARTEGDLDGARALLEDARDLVAAQRGLLATPQLRATWSSTLRGIDEAYLGVLADLHRLRPSEGFAARAFEASESASARSLLEELAGRRVRTDDATSALAARARSVREQLTSALDRQVRARAVDESQAALEPLAHEVRELSAEHQRFQSALRAADSGDATTARAEPLRLAEVQQHVIEGDATLLEFFLGAERGYAWVVGRDRLHFYELPSRARIEAAVEAARAAVSASPTDAGSRRASQALGALADLILPADRGWLAGRRLVVVPDGALHYAPFAALPDATGDPLLGRLEIVNVPSASVAAALRRLAAERAPAPRSIAVVADPVYDAGDERLRRPEGPRVAEATLARATRGFGFQDGRLPRLPFTRREALAITALAPASSKVALDFGANLDTALSPDLASYRYVHFAAHGLLNDARPELSGLVLSLVDRDGRTRPGLLTAPDVSSLRLQADLVVLSSCRSAAGREVRGEGLVGLTRAFMTAGAPRVVASLWPVDDMASAELMTAMYWGMLGPSKLSPAAALRRAQMAMLRHRKWKAPYYWAGFQLQGEWR